MLLVAVCATLSFGVVERAVAQDCIDDCPAPGENHNFGVNFQKGCPVSAGPGEMVTCTFTIENNDECHRVDILDLTDQVPFGVPGFPDGPVVPLVGCATSLAPSDGVEGSGPDFTTCDVTFTIPNDTDLCGGAWLDQGEVDFQDFCIPVLTDTNQASGIIVIVCPCGDDVVNQDDETCDGTDDDVCINGCRPPGDPNECTCCGDGIVQGDEQCEIDAQCPTGQSCVACVCQAVCGDNIAGNTAGETCDGTDAMGCVDMCRDPGTTDECTCCGDDVLQASSGETCDGVSDATCNAGQSCRDDCTCCGDDNADTGEFCDGSDDSGCNAGQSCRDDCTCCGDGIVNGGEECDGTAGTCGKGAACRNDCTCPPVVSLECRMTGGGNMDQRDNDGNWFTWGGQIGAPTASKPQPCGEWTHRQHAGPGGKWTFHAGTASAPSGTEIDFVECCDEGWCSPARRAPAKQILWEGVGTFKNVHIVPNPDAPVEDQPVKGETFHWFEARVEDLGEPGSHDLDPELDCPAEGFACSEGLCGCPDFYTITIYKGVRPDSEGNLTLNKTDYIYKIYGYLRGGNHQIHPIIRGRHSCVGGGN